MLSTHSPVEDVFGVDVLLELLDGRQEVVRVLRRLPVPLTCKEGGFTFNASPDHRLEHHRNIQGLSTYIIILGNILY